MSQVQTKFVAGKESVREKFHFPKGFQKARYVKFLVHAFHGHPSMRAGVLGKDDGKDKDKKGRRPRQR